jgi:hypothetical protein
MAAGLLTVLVAVGCADDQRTVRSAWDLAAPVTPGETEFEVVVYVGSSSCNVFDRTEIEESDLSVTVSAWTTDTRGEDDCTADLGVVREVVQLEAPLGARALVGCRPEGELSASLPGPLPSGEDCRAALDPPPG